jgi:carboxyl-terminal processing protease
MSRWNLGWVLGVSGVVLLGYAVSHSAPTRERDKDYELVRLVVDVLDEVEHKYVRPLDDNAKRKLIEDMINGGLESLDQHSSFINPKELKRFTLTNRGKIGGVGIQVGMDRVNPRQLIVISPMVDTPAYEAGILSGDNILKIDGKSTENFRIADAVDLIQGDPGSKVVLTVLHQGAKAPVDVELTRAEIELQSVLGDRRLPNNPKDWDFLIDRENRIGYVRLTAFNENTAPDFRTVVERLQKDSVRGLIVDLRGNPGGLLKSAVDVSRMFLSAGRIVSTRGRNQREETYDAIGEPGVLLLPADKHPLVVLINRWSASASEIVAAALQDHGRAVIIGERSYGKGSVQNILPMEENLSALKLTTASYWRPSGKNIHRFPDSKDSDEWGVKPDAGFEVPITDEERVDYVYYRRDRDRIPGKAPAPATERGKKEQFVDRTLEKALAYARDEIKKKS